MLIRMKDLKSLRMVARDGSRHAVLDLFVDTEGRRVTHVVSRLGSWFEDRQCVLRAAAFEEPDLDAGVWRVGVGREDVEDAADGTADGRLVTQLASKDAEADPGAIGASECEAAGASAGAVRSLTALLGAPLRAPDRQAGTLMDAVVETDDRSVAMLVAHAGGHAEHQRAVPSGMVARVDWDEPAVILRCDAASVDGSPELHEVGERLHGRWYNQVSAYYGLG